MDTPPKMHLFSATLTTSKTHSPSSLELGSLSSSTCNSSTSFPTLYFFRSSSIGSSPESTLTKCINGIRRSLVQFPSWAQKHFLSNIIYSYSYFWSEVKWSEVLVHLPSSARADISCPWSSSASNFSSSSKVSSSSTSTNVSRITNSSSCSLKISLKFKQS